MVSTTCKELTQDILKEHLSYCPITGIFKRLQLSKYANKWGIGDIAGADNGKGYIQLYLLGKVYLAHKLAFLYMTGSIPDLIDHIDLNRSNNSWDNLREATRNQNQYNRKANKNTKSGHKNITWHNRDKVYQVRIGYKGSEVYLGRFKELDKAIEAASLGREKYHKEFKRHT